MGEGWVGVNVCADHATAMTRGRDAISFTAP
jgi:hypothetical protein